MTRAFAVFAIAACSSSSAPLPSPSPAAPVPIKRPAIARAEALDYISATSTYELIVAGSLDELDTMFGSTLGAFEDITGVALAGVSRSQPVGVVRVSDGHWIAFADVVDAKAFDASVPEDRREHRGRFGFVGDSWHAFDALQEQRGPHAISRDPLFRDSVDALHRGDLVGIWMSGHSTGIDAEAGKLQMQTTGKVVVRSLASKPTLTHDAMDTLAPAELDEARRQALRERGRIQWDLDGDRWRIVMEVEAEIGVSHWTAPNDQPAVERTFVIPGGDAKAWLASRVARFRAPAVEAKLRDLDARIAKLDERIASAARTASKRVPKPPRVGGMREQAEALAQLMVGGPEDPAKGRGSGAMTPEAFADAMTAERRDLGPMPHHEASGTPQSVGVGGGSRVGGGPHQPTVAISDPGNAALYAHLHGRLARVRACYERALELDPKLDVTVTLALSADGAGAVTARASGAEKSLASCIEIAARGTSGAKSESASFAVRLEP